MKMEFDLCISGVNRGLNMGRDIMYSGTVAAAYEAVNLGIPAVALSTSPENYPNATRDLDTVLDYFRQHDLLGMNDIYNVNLPNETKSVRITRQGGPYYSDDFPQVGENLFRPTGKPVWVSSNDLTLDTDATLAGYITITPLTLDRTHRELFRKLESLNG